MPAKVVTRNGDMSPRGRLRLIFQEDGDCIVAIDPDPEQMSGSRNSVEFLQPFAGGGRSSHTLKALRKLAEAMERDNKERPIEGSLTRLIQ